MGSEIEMSALGGYTQPQTQWGQTQAQNQFNEAYRKNDFAQIMGQSQQNAGIAQQTKKVTMFGSIKKYFDDHRDLLMTLVVLVIVDQWVFDGAFKEKIKGLIDRVVGHADNKIKELEKK